MTSHEYNKHAQSPLRGVLLCCTAIPAEERSTMAAVVQQMGGTHMLDLTSDVTHLIVGDIDTPKYKYVARERPDIKVLKREWLDAVRDVWLEGSDVDVEALEEEYRLPVFEGLRICLTGFETEELRKSISDRITSNGARYDPDLSKRVSHLVAKAPQGKKYDHAVLWGIKVVSPEWIDHSLARGMALDEACYNPLLPESERGRGAVLRSAASVQAGNKRQRADEAASESVDSGRRKLRRTTSAKLGSQNDGIWADIGSDKSRPQATRNLEWSEPANAPADKESGFRRHTSNVSDAEKDTQPLVQDSGILQGKAIAIHGFDERKRSILCSHLEANGATIVTASEKNVSIESGRVMHIVPHELSPGELSKLVERETIPQGGLIVTDWWVERCLHFKRAVDPSDDILSRPLPSFPISGFNNEVICPTSFSGVNLLHFSKLVKFLGAKYDEYLNPSTTILVCNSKTPNLEKVKYALQHGIAVVFADWVWECLVQDTKLPYGSYQISAPPASRSKNPSSDEAATGRGEQASSAEHARAGSTRPATTPGADVRRPGRNPRLELSFTRRAPQRAPTRHEESRSVSQPLRMTKSPDTLERLKKHRSFIDTGYSRFASPLGDIAPEVNTAERRSPSLSSAGRGTAMGVENQPINPAGASESATAGDPLLTTKALTEDIANLLARNKASNGSSATDNTTSRRPRTLGRATSNPASLASMSRSRDFAFAGSESAPIDDSFSAKSIESIMPSQVLSYEEADTPAQRESLMKRIGIDNTHNVMQGMQRVESIGLVKDAEGGVAERVGSRRRNARRK